MARRSRRLAPPPELRDLLKDPNASQNQYATACMRAALWVVTIDPSASTVRAAAEVISSVASHNESGGGDDGGLGKLLADLMDDAEPQGAQ